MPRYTVCPFYKDENHKTISCEDTYRRFELLSEKNEWMDRYCDVDWKECPYAQDMWAAYEEADERGDDVPLKDEKIRALKKELHKQSSMLGRAEKRVMELEQTLLTTFQQYEARFCYLMIKFNDGRFDEKDFWEWAEGKEFRLVGMDRDQDGKPTWWKAEVKEAEEDGIPEEKNASQN